MPILPIASADFDLGKIVVERLHARLGSEEHFAAARLLDESVYSGLLGLNQP